MNASTLNISAVAPFFRQPVALCGDAHRYHALLPQANYQSAALSTALPLGIGEFFSAARHSPIVFSTGPQPVALMVTGLTEGHNLFMTAQGEWRDGYHIPTCLRQYPFTRGSEPGAAEGMMYVDQSCPRLIDARHDPHSRRLFDDAGNTSAPMQDATAFCLSAYHQAQHTAAFCQALQALGVLADSQYRVTFRNGCEHSVAGFRCIDEKLYWTLPAAILAEWFLAGWLDNIAFQIASQHNWHPQASSCAASRLMMSINACWPGYRISK